MEASSRFVVKTTDGLRVAVAGLPGTMTVVIDEDLNLTADTVQQLRELAKLPCAIEVAIPYRIGDDSVVTISPQETGGER